MNEIIRLPSRLRLVADSTDVQLARQKPRYAAFCRARSQMFERLRELMGSDELTDDDLGQEVEATGQVPRTLLGLRRADEAIESGLSLVNVAVNGSVNSAVDGLHDDGGQPHG